MFPQAGWRTRLLDGEPPRHNTSSKQLCADHHGFSLRAAVRIGDSQPRAKSSATDSARRRCPRARHPARSCRRCRLADAPNRWTGIESQRLPRTQRGRGLQPHNTITTHNALPPPLIHRRDWGGEVYAFRLLPTTVRIWGRNPCPLAGTAVQIHPDTNPRAPGKSSVLSYCLALAKGGVLSDRFSSSSTRRSACAALWACP